MQFKKNDYSIGFVCSSLDNMAGGLERQILRTCEAFTQKGYRVFLFSFDNEEAIPFYKIPIGVNWIKCGQGLIPHSKAPLYLRLKQIIFLRKKIFENHISQVITFHHGLFPRTFLACLFLNVKLIVSERNSLSLYDHIKLSKFNIGFLSMFFTDYITVQIPIYKKEYPIFLRKRIFVISNFIKIPLAEYKEPNLKINKISLIGRLCAQKNFHILFDQIQESKYKKDITIDIAGEGDLLNQFYAKYINLIENATINFKGNVKDIDNFLSNSSIYCLTSLWEGYPNSLAEALRMCLPVVVSKRFEGLNDFVEHGVNGYIVSDEYILEAILFLLKNKKLLLSMSKESYKKYCKLYRSNPSLDWYKLISK